MTLRSILDQLVNLFGKPVQETSSRPDGGTSCYRPARKKRRDEEPQGEIPGAQPQGEPAQASIPYAHTGFTGMNPPAGYGQSAGYFRHEEESAPRPPVLSTRNASRKGSPARPPPPGIQVRAGLSFSRTSWRTPYRRPLSVMRPAPLAFS